MLLVALLTPRSAAAANESEPPPIGLDEAVRQALTRNPSARAALVDVARAEALLAQARSASLPQLSANGIYTRLDDHRILNGRTIAGRDQLTGNVLLTVPLIAPRAWSQWSRARENVEVASSGEREARQTVAIAVARAYLSAIAQRRVLEVNQRAVRTATDHEQYARTRFEGGLGNKLDQVRAAQEVATSTAALAATRIALVRSQEALGVLVGEKGPLTPREDVSLPAAPTLEQARHDAEQRPDLAAQRARAQAAKHWSRDNYVDFLPILTGNFQPFYQNPPTLTMPLTGWQAQLVLTIPLYDGGARYGVHRERRAVEEQQDLRLENAVRQANADLRVAFEAMKQADVALEASREAAKMAREALRLATLAYEAGASATLEVIDAERRARDADTDVAVKEDDARSARLDLMVASGRFP